MVKYDLAILGGGPGGYVAAIRASQLGHKVCVIEMEKLGGVCLNWGCIPTKALLKNAEVYKTIKDAHLYGISTGKVSANIKKIVQRSREASKKLSKGIEFLMNKNGITHISGFGKLIGGHDLIVTIKKEQKKISAKNIIIATGARPKLIPGVEIDGKQIIGSKAAMVLETLPKKILIIGSGAIGCEFAYYFNSFGVEVQIIEIQNRILPMEDEEISKTVEKCFKDSGIKVLTNSKVEKIAKLKNKVNITVKNESIFSTDLVLVATGVQGNIEDIGLNKIGIKTRDSSIVIDEYCRTNISSVYAIGDVAGGPWLAHKASAQGHLVADYISGQEVHEIDYSNIPSCTYSQPQIGSLGLTELQAKEMGHDVKIGKFSFNSSGKALATGDTTGFVKLIFDSKYGELLGAHIVGSEATEMIAELNIAKSLEATWENIAMTMHAHPTLSEAIMEAALDAYDSAIHH